MFFEKVTPFTISSEEELKSRLQTGLKRGYFECNQEINEGVVSFAAPVFDAMGNVEAAISVYGAASEINAKRDYIVENLLAAVRECTTLNKQRIL